MLFATLNYSLRRLHRLPLVLSRSKSVAGFREVWIEQRFQKQFQARLDHSVPYTRYPEQPHPFAPGLRYFHPPHRTRFVAPPLKLRFQVDQLFFQPTLEHLDAHPVTSGAPAVGLYRGKALPQRRRLAQPLEESFPFVEQFLLDHDPFLFALGLLSICFRSPCPRLRPRPGVRRSLA